MVSVKFEKDGIIQIMTAYNSFFFIIIVFFKNEKNEQQELVREPETHIFFLYGQPVCQRWLPFISLYS